MTDTADITFALRNLGAFASGIIPSQVSGRGMEATREDGREFVKDLHLLAAKVDAVILAYGEYLNSNGVVSKRDLRDDFTDVLFRALHGNATFCIENGIEERLEALREAAE